MYFKGGAEHKLTGGRRTRKVKKGCKARKGRGRKSRGTRRQRGGYNGTHYCKGCPGPYNGAYMTYGTCSACPS